MLSKFSILTCMMVLFQPATLTSWRTGPHIWMPVMCHWLGSIKVDYRLLEAVIAQMQPGC
eukprot:2945112-Rhodomonas_salina.3